MTAATSPSRPGEASAAAASRLIGCTLRDTYRILDLLDEGGMGFVFLAEHMRLRRRVAVKVLARHLAQMQPALARFEREAEVISQLQHPHVVNVLDFDRTDAGEPYLVMELLQGETLKQRLEREGTLPVEEALAVASQVADGLGAAHRVAIVHRDLKPANVFLVYMDEEGAFVKLLDFGISKLSSQDTRLTGTHDIIGTPDYMSPEQASGRTALVDHRGDQYSLAVIVYEMLTGTIPFTGKTVPQLLQRVISEPPPSLRQHAPHLPEALDQVLQRALAKQPEARYTHVGEFAAALARAAGEGAGFPGLLRTHSTMLPASPRDEAGSRSHAATVQADTGYRGVSSESGEMDYVPPPSLRRPHRTSSLPPGGTSEVVAGALAKLRQGVDSAALERRLLVDPAAMTSSSLTAQEAFLISRIDYDVNVELLLDLSPLGRDHTLKLLEGLARRGLIRFEA